MAKLCPDCIYYDPTGTICRVKAPYAELSGNTPVTLWPKVGVTDWCAEGWNPTDGYYDPRGFSDAHS